MSIEIYVDNTVSSNSTPEDELINVNTNTDINNFKLLGEIEGSLVRELVRKLETEIDQLEIYNFIIDNINDDHQWVKNTMFPLYFNIDIVENNVPFLMNPREEIWPFAYLAANYFLNGAVRELPYTNYKSLSDTRCVYNVLKHHYKRASKKKIETFNRDDVSLAELIDFTDHYKIKTALLNVNGDVLYKNDYEQNTNHRNLYAIICNNHIYPCIDKKQSNGYKPQLKEERVTQVNEDNILYSYNHKTYGYEGCKVEKEVKVNKKFFEKVNPNFTYKSDCIKFLTLHYNTIKDVNKQYYGYDIKKAYYSCILDLNDKEEFPIFTVLSFWSKYDLNIPIDNTYYYSFSKKSLEKLRPYGIISNVWEGKMIIFLLSNKLIDREEIEYYKAPSYSYEWGHIKNRILKLLQEEHPEANIKTLEEGLKYSADFITHNGVLGKTMFGNPKKFTNLNEEELHLLNQEKVRWYRTEGGFQTKSEKYFRYYNNVHIYNHVIQETCLKVLHNVLHIKKTRNLLPICIKTDCIVYDREVELLTPKLFRLEIKKDTYVDNLQDLDIKENELIISTRCLKQKYISIEKVITDVFGEFDNFSNICYTGAPGTGKTTIVLANHKYDMNSTITNKCLLNIMKENEPEKSKTIYSLFQLFNPMNFVGGFNRYYGTTFWIDEFSMVPLEVWGYIFIMCKDYDCNFIFSGDTNQLPPIKEKPIDITHTFFKKVFGKITELTKDHRNSKELVELRNRILKRVNVWDYIPKTKKGQGVIYNVNCNTPVIKDVDFRDYDKHIAWTNNACNYINQEIMKKRNLSFNPEKGQVDIGVNLTVRKTMKHLGIFKGQTFKAESKKLRKVDVEKEITVKTNGKEIKRKRLVKVEKVFYTMVDLTRDDIKEVIQDDLIYFKLGFCNTTHSSQGDTIKGKFCIHECRGMFSCDKSILYTAITRGKNLEDITFFCNNYPITQALKLPKINSTNEDEIDYFCRRDPVKFN